jgi:RNA 2',3'-cyclic 3'-phosphodiesterase
VTGSIGVMRLFIGIPLAAQVIEELSAICQRLRSARDGLRWSAPVSWHITLQFLGETPENQYNCLLPRLRGIKAPGISMRLEGLDAFDRVGVFFAGVDVSPQLALLQRHVTAATAQCGFVAETRPYHPHVTLARAKGDRRGRSLRELKSKVGREPRFSSFTANEFLLCEAFLSPAGSRYEVRERFIFAAPIN